MPAAYHELDAIRGTLEKHFKDVQDFEFTIQEGKVFMLQTRNGKRTGLAAVSFAVDMVKEKLIDWENAIKRDPAEQLDQVLAPVFDTVAIKKAKVIANGLPAGPGAATGKIYFNADRAVIAAERREKVLLVRIETSPEDLRGMIAAEGILTATRRCFLPRGARRPPDGQGLHLRRRRSPDRLRHPHPDRRGPDLQAGRLHLHRRHLRYGLRR